MKQRLCLTILIFALAAGAAQAITIDLLDVNNRILWNTGFAGGTTLGANGAVDANYLWNGTSAYVFNPTGTPFPASAWNPNKTDTNSPDDYAWINPLQPLPNGSLPTAPANVSAFVTTSLALAPAPNVQSWDVELQGRLWADNWPRTVELLDSSNQLISLFTLPTPGTPGSGTNGATGDRGYASSYLGNFALVATGLAPGTYTIRFEVFNLPGTSSNPTGLQVNWTRGLAYGIVPEPGSIFLMGAIGGALFLLNRRRSKSA